MKKILVIDDEKEICRSIKGILGDEGYAVEMASTPEEALSMFSRILPDLVLLDVWFGKSSWDGVHLLEQLKQQHPMLPVIMISGHGTFELAVKAIKKGAYDFIEKPFEVDRLLLAVQRGLETSQLRFENASYRHGLSGYSTGWPLPLDVTLRKVACTETRVLFLGQIGTGKKSLAHEIHKLSSRQTGPFLVLNSYEINTYLDEVMWGTERNDTVECPGILEYAQGGTVVLTNVHALSRPLQIMFARIFESSTVVRIGSKKPIPLNVRFLLTARPELDNVASSMHREFYDRINVLVFPTLCLAKKTSNIRIWADLFLKDLCFQKGCAQKFLSKETLKILQAYAWPGNIRQLRNILEQTVLNSTDQEILTTDLPSEVSGVLSSLSSDIFSLPLQKARTLFEYHYLSAQLASVNGNVSHAAQVIGMERSALHRKIKSLKIKTTNKTEEEKNLQHRR